MKLRETTFVTLLGLLLCGFVPSEPKNSSAKSPSLLDIPEKSLYYGFVVNRSAHFTELEIWSEKERRKLLRNIVLPPPKSSIQKNPKALEYWDRSVHMYRPPNVFSLWLSLGTYKILIRKRDDIIGGGSPGTIKTFTVVLDKEYVENAPGPFVFEIEDD